MLSSRIPLIGGYTAEARALFAAMTVAPDAAHRRSINNFIKGLKATAWSGGGTLWSAIDYMSAWGALHDAQASRINWKTPTLIGTAVNSPTFVADQGYTFDGATSYIGTGWIASTMAVNVTQNNNFMGVYEGTNITNGGYVAGVNSTWGINPRRSVDVLRVTSMMTGTRSSAALVTDSRGFTGLTRSTGGILRQWKAGTFFEANTITGTDVAVPSTEIFIGGLNAAGVLASARPTNFRGRVLAGAFTDADEAAFYTLAQASLAAINAHV